MTIHCPECGAANSQESKRCRICNASLPGKDSKPDYGKFDFESNPKKVKDIAPPTYLGWSILMTFCCCSPLAILAIIFGAQSAAAFKKKDFDRADRKSEVTRKVLIWGLVLAFVTWIVIFVSGIFD